jgi:flagellar basal body-associated protein FliL
MGTVAWILLVLLVVVLPLTIVGVLFVWGAVKDGQADRALQTRLGIRRRTRLGR